MMGSSVLLASEVPVESTRSMCPGLGEPGRKLSKISASSWSIEYLLV